MKVFVFDVDGTLSNLEHRISHIQGSPKDWKTFNSLVEHDTPHEDIIWLSNVFAAHGRIIICTGREEVYLEQTANWLEKHGMGFDAIYMRPAGDYRHDDIIKKELLEQIRKDYGEPYMWFDDRSRVVDAIREEGIRVLQVAPGDF